MKWKIANAAGAAAFAALCAAAYRWVPPYRALVDFGWSFAWGPKEFASARFPEIFLGTAAAFAAGYALWFLFAAPDAPAKPALAWRCLWKIARNPANARTSPDERHALLATLVKLQFMPLMAKFLFENAASFAKAAGNVLATWREAPSWGDLYAVHGHWAILYGALLLDTAVFFAAYALEHEKLGNRIRSVEPTVLGWAAALACYPVLNSVTGAAFGWYASDFPNFAAAMGSETPWRTVSLAAGALSVSLMCVYAWASLALGMKGGNLCARGTVDRGPYRWVRHPAYAAKNLAWGISALVPMTAGAAAGKWGAVLAAACSVAAWAGTYHLRAVTEERHLASVDPDYRAYKKRVRWRYLPGVY